MGYLRPPRLGLRGRGGYFLRSAAVIGRITSEPSSTWRLISSIRSLRCRACRRARGPVPRGGAPPGSCFDPLLTTSRVPNEPAGNREFSATEHRWRPNAALLLGSADRALQVRLAHLRAAADVQPLGFAHELIARLGLAPADLARLLAEGCSGPLRQVLERLLALRARLRLLHVALRGASLLGCSHISRIPGSAPPTHCGGRGGGDPRRPEVGSVPVREWISAATF